jgi:hypothetical protein
MEEKKVRRVSLAGLATSLTGAGLVYFSNVMADEPVVCNQGSCIAYSEYYEGYFGGQCAYAGAFLPPNIHVNPPQCGCEAWGGESAAYIWVNGQGCYSG